MRAHHVLAFAAAFFLVACAFWSERPLFAASEAAHPFADGARFIWREHDSDERFVIVYTRSGAGYILQDESAPDERPIEMMLVPVPETPEQDFIAQVTLPNADTARAYAFLWPVGEGYRVFAAPTALDELAEAEATLARYCTQRPQGECKVDTREGVLAIYRDVIYPRYVAGGATPSDYMDMVPAPNGR